MGTMTAREVDDLRIPESGVLTVFYKQQVLPFAAGQTTVPLQYPPRTGSSVMVYKYTVARGFYIPLEEGAAADFTREASVIMLTTALTMTDKLIIVYTY